MVEHEKTGPLDSITWGLSRITMWLPAFIVAIIFFEVTMRYVFGRATMWVNETSLWVAGAVYLFAGLYSMQQRSHIRIYIIYDMFPRWLKKAADTLSVSLIVLFTTCLVWGSYNEAVLKFSRMEKYGTAWNPPIPATVKPAILILIILVTIQAISNLIADWNKDTTHSPEDDIDQTEIENIRRTLEG